MNINFLNIPLHRCIMFSFSEDLGQKNTAPFNPSPLAHTQTLPSFQQFSFFLYFLSALGSNGLTTSEH